MQLSQKEIEEIEYIPLPINKPMDKPKNDLDLLCEAIKEYEGWFPPSPKHPRGSRSWRNNNPGNCKFSKVGYLKKYGDVKSDGTFAIFPTYELGWMYLQNLIKQHANESPNLSIANYIKKIYAPASDNNDPASYASYIGKKMGVNPITFTLGDLTML